jgi:hypothetical protein
MSIIACNIRELFFQENRLTDAVIMKIQPPPTPPPSVDGYSSVTPFVITIRTDLTLLTFPPSGERIRKIYLFGGESSCCYYTFNFKFKFVIPKYQEAILSAANVSFVYVRQHRFLLLEGACLPVGREWVLWGTSKKSGWW